MTMADPLDDLEFEPFPSELEMVRQHCSVLEAELDDTNCELRACRQRIAVLVVQHGSDANELARARTELTRMAWELSNARLQVAVEVTQPVEG
jgi:hypothetical protein